jgi:hypothetical protein
MPYLNLDDEFTEHPKVDALSDGAFRLHVSGMRYCCKNLTDGIIPVARVDRLKPAYKPSQLNELLRGKVWHRGGDGCGTEHCPVGDAGEYVIHDYLQWNRSAEWWEARRKAETERKAKYRREQAEKEQRLAELEARAPKGLRSI